MDEDKEVCLFAVELVGQLVEFFQGLAVWRVIPAVKGAVGAGDEQFRCFGVKGHGGDAFGDGLRGHDRVAGEDVPKLDLPRCRPGSKQFGVRREEEVHDFAFVGHGGSEWQA